MFLGGMFDHILGINKGFYVRQAQKSQIGRTTKQTVKKAMNLDVENELGQKVPSRIVGSAAACLE